MGTQLKPHDAVMASSRQALGMMNDALGRRPAEAPRHVCSGSLYGCEHPHACGCRPATACSCGGRCDGRMGCLSCGGAQ